MSTLKTGKVKTTTIADELDTESTAVTNVINGSAKAWVNFDGTGTVSIRESFNVSSISDIGSGDYIVNFATAMPDTKYAALGTWSTVDNNWSGAFQSSMIIGGNYANSFTPHYSTTQVGVCNYAAATFVDIEQVNIVVFR